MAYSRPKSYGYTQTPAPGGGGGGAGLIPWTEIPLDPAGFVVYGQGTDWILSNPTPTTLRASADHTAKLTWDNTGTQTGLVLIWPVVMDPFPIVPAPAGFTAAQWRSDYSILKLSCELTLGPTDASGTPQTIQGGPGLVTFTNAQGVAPAGPPFTNTSPEPSWYLHQITADRGGANDEWNAAWTGCGVGDWKNPGGGQNLPAFGAVGQANQAEMVVGYGGYPYHHPRITWSWQDDRSPTTSPNWVQEWTANFSVPADFQINTRYVYPALFFGNHNLCQIGDFVDIHSFKVGAFQMPQRGAE